MGQFKDLIKLSSLGQFNELSPAQTVVGKDISNPFMGEAFPKSLLIQLTQQVAKILKKNLRNEVESESPRSNNNPKKENKDD